MLSLYIHIPFCQSKCKYCDFTSFIGNRETIDNYMACLIRELEIYGQELEDRQLDTIFIGGGTPSSIDPGHIYNIMEAIHKNYDMARVREISLESNPGDINGYKAGIYREAGINRISMGAQSFNDRILERIGRSHRELDIYRSLEELRGAGFDNINLDLMFGLPGQDWEELEASLAKALALDLEHISNYSLILEESTQLYREFLRGDFRPIDEDLDRRIYHRIREGLLASGYRHYEISNFAKPGRECLHNLAYWNIKPYLGLGLSSHSNLAGERFSNTRNIRKYMEALARGEKALDSRETISKSEEIAEYAIMGFRKIRGINKLDFRERFCLDFDEYFSGEISKNLARGLIVNGREEICLSEKGLDLCNQVELDFYKP